MSGFSDYLAEISAGLQECASDIAGSAIRDIGDTGQEILMQDASIGPADPLPGTYETVTTTTEPDTGGVALESYGPDTNDAIPGLDIG